MAGRLSRLPSRPTADQPGETDAVLPRQSQVPDDHAARAPLVVVQFPREQINVVGARWLVVRALDALRYIAQTAATMTPEGEPLAPLVVNISYGSMVGAHDGTGLFETAMAELSAAHKRMAIVLAAGNSHGTRRANDSPDDLLRVPSGRHAVHDSLAPAETTLLRLYIPPNKAIETYLEIWFEDHGANAEHAQFLERDDIDIAVTSPTGKALRVGGARPVDFDDPDSLQTGSGLISFPRVAQSSRRSMALLVVAATQMSASRIEVPSGTWSVEVTNRSTTRTFRVQAWVERDLVAGAARRSQAARLLEGTEPHAAMLTDENTFNNIATGDEVFRAGALMANGAGAVADFSPYSSAAATAGAGPEFSAVADERAVRLGVRVSGNVGGAVVRVNGTSMAAPQAARWLANRLAASTRTAEAELADIRREIAQADADARIGRIRI